MSVDRELFKEAKRYLPGGVNSPVRAFKSVGGLPVFIKKGKGAYLYGENNRHYIDYCLSWGALILGHNHSQIRKAISQSLIKGTSFGTNTVGEIELAKLIVKAYPSIEQVRLTNSGTEAVMSAVRLARAFTGKDKIIKFDGAYHGHSDYLLVKPGSGGVRLAKPYSLGVPKDFIRHTLIANYNDITSLKMIMDKYRDISAVLIEPVLANCGLILPQPGFLKEVRRLCDYYKCLLIFDEVITGFRISYGGASHFFGVKPDLVCLGKILGGGLPIGALAGKKKIMRLLAPQGDVYQAGTLSGNPLSVSSGIATLKILKRDNPYPYLKERTKALCEEIKAYACRWKINLQINYLASMFGFFFSPQPISNYEEARLYQDTKMFSRFFKYCLEGGVYFSPSPWETNFISTQHSLKDIDFTKRVVERALKRLV